MRATLHLMSARDYAALRGALQPALDASMASILKARGEGIVVDDVLAAARKLLARGKRADLRRDPRRRCTSSSRTSTTARSATSPAPACRWRWCRPTTPGASRATRGSGWSGKSTSRRRPRSWCAATWPRSAPPRPPTCRSGPGLKGLKDVFEASLDELEVVDKRPLRPARTRRGPAPTSTRPSASCPPSTTCCSRTRTGRGSSTTSTARRSSRRTCASRRRSWSTASRPASGTIKATKKKATLTLEPFGKLTKKAQKELAAGGGGAAALRRARGRDAAVSFDSDTCRRTAD